MLEQVPFSFIFTTHQNGSITTKRDIRIGGVFVASGVTIGPGTTLAGIDLTQYKNRELGIIFEGTTCIIKEVY